MTYAPTVRAARRVFAQALTVVVALVLGGALILVWSQVVRELGAPPAPAPPIGQPQAVVWNEHVFTSDRQLKHYLTARGIPYAQWASRHPSAFAVVKHKLPAEPAAKSSH